MAVRLYRTQVLLEPEQHQMLAEIARREGRSVSEVLRELIRQQLAQRKQTASEDVKRRTEALTRLRQHRDDMLARRGGKPLEIDVVELVRQMREERDERNLTGVDDRR